ncbi:MAG: hypothetical protein WB783_16910, partial [Arenicellales bacterium]
MIVGSRIDRRSAAWRGTVVLLALFAMLAGCSHDARPPKPPPRSFVDTKGPPPVIQGVITAVASVSRGSR